MEKKRNMKKLGAAIIGCGWVAEEYVKAFQKDQRISKKDCRKLKA